MLRYLTAIFFLFAFTAQTFQQAVILLGYYANPSSYAKNCENKARPTLHCNGKCQMMKKMQEEEKKNQQLPEHKPGGKNEVISAKTFLLPVPSFKSFFLKRAYTTMVSPKATGRSFAIFHPPCMVAFM